jgi:hypothetical protein
MRTSRISLIAAALSLAAAVPCIAQGAELGFHFGVNFDSDDALVGAQLAVPLGRRVDLYPSFDYYFIDPGTLNALNIDIRFRQPARTIAPYLGGGLNILSRDGNSDTGVGLFGGLAGRGPTRPYIELRALLHDDSSLQLVGGVSFRL